MSSGACFHCERNVETHYSRRLIEKRNCRSVSTTKLARYIGKFPILSGLERMLLVVHGSPFSTHIPSERDSIVC